MLNINVCVHTTASYNCALNPILKRQNLHHVHGLFIISAEIHAQQMLFKRLGSGNVNPYDARQNIMAGVWQHRGYIQKKNSKMIYAKKNISKTLPFRKGALVSNSKIPH